jgi:poly-gamma-glutamate synthesis protein (capsule biosynthesis protein)
MKREPAQIRLALCGDVMLGRGIDQILPHPGDPTLYGPYARSAHTYLTLAERVSGPIPLERGVDYVWGDVLAEFDSFAPDLRLINLETAITRRGKPWPKKSIQYRMEPRNIAVLTAARVDFCSLANNHVMDWGYRSLGDTIKALADAGIARAGAGRDRADASAPAILDVAGKGRVIVASMATPSGHVPPEWASGEGRPGVNLVEPDEHGFDEVKQSVLGLKQPGDILIASIHAGANFGYAVEPGERTLFRRMIDEAGIDLIHCHSPHHVKAIEMHNGRPILYGTGDVINDYEGIPSPPERQVFRSHLGTIAFADFSTDSGACTALRLRPTKMRRLRVERAAGRGAEHLCEILGRESAQFGTRIENRDGTLTVEVARR